jgi:hypothetical protein
MIVFISIPRNRHSALSLEACGLLVHLFDHFSHKRHRLVMNLRYINFLSLHLFSVELCLLKDLVHLFKVIGARNLINKCEPFIQIQRIKSLVFDGLDVDFPHVDKVKEDLFDEGSFFSLEF